MLSIGFDPVFIDIIVRAETEDGGLIKQLPPAGHHHRRTSITQLAGGNGVNVAYVLDRLGNKVQLVVPSNLQFDQLLGQRGLRCSLQIHDQVNTTVALTWRPGEIQFNEIGGHISAKHFTRQIYQKWKESPIQLSLNWGLNHGSLSWLSCLWLTSCGWEYEDIAKLDEDQLIAQVMNKNSLQTNFVIEPGSIIGHPYQDQLMQLLATMSSSRNGIYPIFICNEEEHREFESLEFPTTIIHSSQEVTVLQEDHRVFAVPQLEDIITYVGAGDAFLAGLTDALHHRSELDVVYGIEIAQKYMTGSL